MPPVLTLRRAASAFHLSNSSPGSKKLFSVKVQSWKLCLRQSQLCGLPLEGRDKFNSVVRVTPGTFWWSFASHGNSVPQSLCDSEHKYQCHRCENRSLKAKEWLYCQLCSCFAPGWVWWQMIAPRKAHQGTAEWQPAESHKAQGVNVSSSQTQWESVGAPTSFCWHRKMSSQQNMKELTHYEIQFWQWCRQRLFCLKCSTSRVG